MLTINHFSFNSIKTVILAKLKTIYGENSAMIPYQIETSSDGKIMIHHIFKNLFPKAIKVEIPTRKIIVLC